MALIINDLEKNLDLTASELTAVKGGRPFASVFTNTFGRDSNSSAGASAESSAGMSATETFTGVETQPGGWGVAVSIAVSLVTPSPRELIAAHSHRGLAPLSMPV